MDGKEWGVSNEARIALQTVNEKLYISVLEWLGVCVYSVRHELAENGCILYYNNEPVHSSFNVMGFGEKRECPLSRTHLTAPILLPPIFSYSSK